MAGITDAMFIGSLIMLAAGALVVAFLPAVVRPPMEKAVEAETREPEPLPLGARVAAGD